MPVKVSQLLPPPARVPIGDKFLEVRGLTLPEVVQLISDYRLDFVRMLILARSGSPNFVEVMEMAPQMVSAILCFATGSKGDPEEEAAVSLLPAGVQLIAVSEIWKLTVTDQKKIQGLLSEAMEGLRKLNAPPPEPSPAPTSEVSPLKSVS
jgi:hypothetical protein